MNNMIQLAYLTHFTKSKGVNKKDTIGFFFFFFWVPGPVEPGKKLISTYMRLD